MRGRRDPRGQGSFAPVAHPHGFGDAEVRQGPFLAATLPIEDAPTIPTVVFPVGEAERGPAALADGAVPPLRGGHGVYHGSSSQGIFGRELDADRLESSIVAHQVGGGEHGHGVEGQRPVLEVPFELLLDFAIRERIADDLGTVLAEFSAANLLEEAVAPILHTHVDD